MSTAVPVWWGANSDTVVDHQREERARGLEMRRGDHEPPARLERGSDAARARRRRAITGIVNVLAIGIGAAQAAGLASSRHSGSHGRLNPWKIVF